MGNRLQYILLSLFLILTGCTKPFEINPDPSLYAEIEKEIRSEYDDMAVFTWGQYSELLTSLSQDKFVVLPLNEMRNHYDNSKVVVGLRHDVDHNPFKALEMAVIEKSVGIRSTFFLLATADYYGTFSNSKLIRHPGMESLYRLLYNTGAEIGIHNDLLAVMILYGMDPYVFNKNELSFYRSMRIPVYGTAAHGSMIARATVPNYQIFSDFAKKDSVQYLDKKYPLGIKSLQEFGFEYEAYFIDYLIYYSDSGGRWNDPEGFSGILKKLDASVPGDRIQILTHPDWWGKPGNP
jgi:hypothetical protein